VVTSDLNQKMLLKKRKYGYVKVVSGDSSFFSFNCLLNDNAEVQNNSPN
jgi:hypothetical protein